MGTRKDEAPAAEVLPVAKAALVEQFARMLAQLPDAPDGDGDDIVARIMQATNWEDVNVEGSLPDAESQVGREQKIVMVGKRPSDIRDSKHPWYLIIDAVDSRTGETIRWQTSSETIMAQIVRLAMLGNLPALVTVTKAEKPTKAGFYPLSLKVHAADSQNTPPGVGF